MREYLCQSARSANGQIGIRVKNMPPPKLNQLLLELADAARDLQPGHATHTVRDRLLRLIRHVESQDMIPEANWNVGPREGGRRRAPGALDW